MGKSASGLRHRSAIGRYVFGVNAYEGVGTHVAWDYACEGSVRPNELSDEPLTIAAAQHHVQTESRVSPLATG
jgi:hypothetical protein